MILTTKNAKVSLYHDTRRIKSNGLYPVKLRVYYDRAKLFDTGKEVTIGDYENSYLVSKPKGEDLKKLKIELSAIEAKANEVLNDLKDFTFDDFERALFKRKIKSVSIEDHYQAYIDLLESKEKIGTASSYRCSLRSIQAFVKEFTTNKNKLLTFDAITVDFLDKYEQWMIASGNSKTTIGMYLRALRAIFNLAMNDKAISSDIYPFLKYKIPTGKNLKKAVEKDALSALYNAKKVTSEHQIKARDFWFLSFQCNGMNFRDIAELKFKDIQDGYFSFFRHKTINTTKEAPIAIIVPITSYVQMMFNKYGNKPGKPNDYVFPIFKPGMTAKEKHIINGYFIRYVNQHMKKLASLNNVKSKLGTMVARHTFTTVVAREKGLEFAQEALGHTSMKTTQNYWAGFHNIDKQVMAEKLMNFA